MNGLKTLYARMADISAGETLDDGVTLGSVTNTLEKIGVDVLDMNGDIRDTGDLMEDLMGKWSNLTQTQKESVATVIAGKYQLSRFLALMDNSDMYNTYKEGAENSEGTLETMQSEYMESLAGKVAALQAAGEDIISSLFNQDDFGVVLDTAQDILETINGIIDSVGGGLPVLTALSGIMLQMFSQQIAENSARIMTNLSASVTANKNAEYMQANINEINKRFNGNEAFQGEDNSLNTISQGLTNFDQLSADAQDDYLKSARELLEVDTQLAKAYEARYELQDRLVDQVQTTIDAKLEEYEIEQKLYDNNKRSYDNKVSVLNLELEKGRISEEDYEVEQTRLKTEKENLSIIEEELKAREREIEYLDQLGGEARTLAASNEKSAESLIALDEKLQEQGVKSNLAKEAADIELEISQLDVQQQKLTEDLSAKQAKNSVETTLNSVNKLLGGLTSVAFTVQAVNSLMSTWGDESTSTVDKITSTILNLSMTLPMLIPTILDIVKGVKTLTSAIKEMGAAEAFLKLMNPEILAAVAIIAAIAAVVGTLVVAYNSWQDSINKNNNALEEQEEELTRLKETYNETKEAVDDLSSSIDSLKSAKDTLADLTAGTTEWKEAVNEVNNEVLDLLDKYPELAAMGAISNEGGVLTIDEDALQELQDQEEELLKKQQVAQLQQQAQVYEQENKAAIETFAKQYMGKTSSTGINKVISAIESYEATGDNLASQQETIAERLREMGLTTEDGTSALYNLLTSIDANSVKTENLTNTIGDLTTSGIWENVATSNISASDISNQQVADTLGISGTYSDYGTIKPTTSDILSSDKAKAALESNYNDIDFSSLKQTKNSQGQSTYSFKSGDEDISLSAEEMAEVFKKYVASIENATEVTNQNEKAIAAFGGTFEEVDGQITAVYDSTGKVITSMSELLDNADLSNLYTTSQYGTATAKSNDEIRAELKLDDLPEESITKIRESIQAELDENPLQLPEFDISTTRAALKEALSGDEALGEDFWTNLTGFNGQDFLSTDNINAFTQASTMMTSIVGEEVDAFELLGDTTLSSRLAMIQLQETEGFLTLSTKEAENALKLEGIANGMKVLEGFTDEAGDVSDALSELDDETVSIALGIEYDGSEMSLSDALGDINNQLEEWEQQDFSISLSFGANTLESVNETIAALDAESDAINKISNDYVLAYDDIESVVSALPLDFARNLSSMETYANGAIQLNQDILDSALASDDEQVASNTQSKLDMLDTNIEWYEALLSTYDEIIEQGEALANQESIDYTTLSNFRMDADAKVADVNAQYETQMTENSLEASQQSAGFVQNAFNVVSALFSDLVNNAGNAANNIVQVFKNLWANVQSIFSGGGTIDIFSNMNDAWNWAKTQDAWATLWNEQATGLTAKGELQEYIQSITLERDATESSLKQLYTARAKLTSSLSRNTTAADITNHNATTNNSNNGTNWSDIDGIERAYDAYGEINSILERISEQYDRLNKQADRLYGADRIKAINEMREAAANELSILKEKEKIQQAEIKRQTSTAIDYNGNTTVLGFSQLAGLNLETDEYGNITNYTAIEAALMQAANDAVSTYNTAIGKGYSDEVMSALQANAEAAKEDYDNWNSTYSAYQDMISNLEDIQDSQEDEIEALQDAADEIIDAIQSGYNEIREAQQDQQEWNKTITEWADRGLAYNTSTSGLEYYNTTLKDILNDIGLTEGGSLTGSAIANLADRIDDLNNVMAGNEILTGEGTKLSESAAIENLQEARDALEELLEDGVEAIYSLGDEIGDKLDTLKDVVEDRLDAFDNIDSLLSSTLETVELIYGDSAYQQQTAISQQQIATNLLKLDTIKTALDSYESIYKEFADRLAKGETLTQEEIEVMNNAKDEITDLQEEQTSTLNSTLEEIQSMLTSQATQAISEWANNIFGEDIDWLQEEWDTLTRNAEQYYDEVNRAYETQKLEAEYASLLNDAANVSLATQQKISAQMNDQLSYLREKTNLSEYDVKYAQAQLEILQKQIALEEAQNNKSQLKLQRNSSGNYSYVYAANADEVEAAQSALEDATANAYNLSKDALIEAQDNALSAVADAKSQLIEVMTDATLTAEQKATRMQFIIDSLKTYIQGISEDIGDISTNILNDVGSMYTLITDENLGKMEELYQSILDNSNTVLDQIDDRFSLSIDDMLLNYQTIDTETDNLFETLKGYAIDYEQTVSDALASVGTSYDTLVSDSLSLAISETANLNDATSDFESTLNNLTATISNAASQIASWSSALDKATQTASTYISDANDLVQQYAVSEVNEAVKSDKASAGTAVATVDSTKYSAGTISTVVSSVPTAVKYSSGTTSGSSSSSSNSANANADKAEGVAAAIWIMGGTVSGWGNDPVRSGAFAAKGVSGAQDIINSQGPSGQLYSKWWSRRSELPNYYYGAFDIGGYTGNYSGNGIDGKGGKWSILHPQELVLNKEDTRNLLDVVDIVRQLTNSMNSTMALGSNNFSSTGGDTIEQRVEINATFPGVSEAIEIQQAILGLADNAYQVANRNY